MRFIDLGTVSPQYSVSFDRAMFEMHSQGSVDDTLYVYARNCPSISLGRFRDESTDMDVGKASSDGIEIVRRISGGSSIYSDTGQLTYAVVIGRSGLPAGRTDSFGYICRGLVASLGFFGIEGKYKPVNDILVGNRKISGSAQHRNSKTVLQHGSLIIDTPQARIDNYLRDSKPRSYEGTTSIKDILGRVPCHDEMISALMGGFSDIFGDISMGSLSAGEVEKVREVMNKPINPEGDAWRT